MKTWDHIREEFTNAQHKGIRLKYARQVANITGRPLIIYVSDFLSGRHPQQATILSSQDKMFFRDAMQGLEQSSGVDVLVESAGGSAEAAEAIVKMLWASYPSVRFIVPNLAKSAATLLVLGGEEVLMDEQSELGPIDPQMPVVQPNGTTKWSPAALIIQQFSTLLDNMMNNKDMGRLLAPHLNTYFPSLLQECANASKLSATMAAELMEKYMFKESKNASTKKQKAAKIAKELGNFEKWMSHGRCIDIDTAIELKIEVRDLRREPKLRDAVHMLDLSIRETFNRNPDFAKLCENSSGHGTVIQVSTKRK